MYAPSAVTVTVPWAGPAIRLKASGSPSTSDAVTVPVSGVSSAVVVDTALAAGALFTGVIVIATVAAVESSAPSLAWNVNESDPL